MVTKLKVLRMIKEKTQHELSLETGLPSYRISDYETGRVEPNQGELEELGKALGTPASELLLPLSEEGLTGDASGQERKVHELEEAAG